MFEWISRVLGYKTVYNMFDLEKAIESDNLKAVQKILARYPTEDTRYLLMSAAKCSNPEIVKQVLNRASSVHYNRGGFIPLQLAVRKNTPEIVELFLNKGAKTKGCDRNGFTILHSAIERGDPDILKLLLRYGLDVDGPLFDKPEPRRRKRDLEADKNVDGPLFDEQKRFQGQQLCSQDVRPQNYDDYKKGKAKREEINALGAENYALTLGKNEIADIIREHKQKKELRSIHDSLAATGVSDSHPTLVSEEKPPKWTELISSKPPSPRQR